MLEIKVFCSTGFFFFFYFLVTESLRNKSFQVFGAVSKPKHSLETLLCWPTPEKLEEQVSWLPKEL